MRAGQQSRPRRTPPTNRNIPCSVCPVHALRPGRDAGNERRAGFANERSISSRLANPPGAKHLDRHDAAQLGTRARHMAERAGPNSSSNSICRVVALQGVRIRALSGTGSARQGQESSSGRIDRRHAAAIAAPEIGTGRRTLKCAERQSQRSQPRRAARPIEGRPAQVAGDKRGESPRLGIRRRFVDRYPFNSTRETEKWATLRKQKGNANMLHG